MTARRLQALLDLIDHLPQTVSVLRFLATPSWRRAVVARRHVDERGYAEIDRARTSTDADGHVLAALVNGRDEDGAGLSARGCVTSSSPAAASGRAASSSRGRRSTCRRNGSGRRASARCAPGTACSRTFGTTS